MKQTSPAKMKMATAASPERAKWGRRFRLPTGCFAHSFLRRNLDVIERGGFAAVRAAFHTYLVAGA